MKCPACGFETPEAHGYCDFCKEPFRKKPEPAKAPKPQPKVEVPPAVMAKLLEVSAETGKHAGPPAAIPLEFAHLDAGEKIAGPSALLRAAAWMFLSGVLAAGTAAGLYAVHKRKAMRRRRAPPSLESRPAPGLSAPPDAE